MKTELAGKTAGPLPTHHKCRATAWWTSDRTGISQADSAPCAIHFSAPAEFGGLEGRWTPEDLLLSALASCFTTTFFAVADHSKFDYTDLEVEAEGSVVKTSSGYVFDEIVLRPTLTFSQEEQRDRAFHLLEKAKSLCLVSRALAVQPKFEPRIEHTMRLPVPCSQA
ncbi:MAG: OsmC family protein [Terriglobales bacterium]|jgi:peroxiredoxin-like protein